MPDPFILLVQTKALWLPALKWLGSSAPGRKIHGRLKARFRWLNDPKAQGAFDEAFEKGIETYRRDHGDTVSGQAVAQLLVYVAKHDNERRDRAFILDHVFQAGVTGGDLGEFIHRYAHILEPYGVSEEEGVRALSQLLGECLRPAFRAEPLFTDRVGFGEVVALLQDISVSISSDAPDLEGLERDYRHTLAQKYEYLSMQGISPKVQNRTIGIRMRDVFIPLKASFEGTRLLAALRRGGGSTWTLAQELERELVRRTLERQASGNGDASRPSPDAVARRVREWLRTHSRGDDIVPGEASEPESGLNLRQTWQDMVSEGYGIELGTLLEIPRFVIQGDPGSGKSTLTQYIAWAACAGDSSVVGEKIIDRIPIRVRAIEFGESIENQHVSDFAEYLVLAAGQRFEVLVKHAVLNGTALVMLDGLDEVGERGLKARVAEQVADFLADPAYAANSVIATSRIVGYEPVGLLGQYPHFTLSELLDEQIRHFVTSWYTAIDEEMPGAVDVSVERKQLLEAVLDNDSIHRMARNPLLLTIIALIKWQGRALPEQRVLLYDAAAQTLIKSWPLSQRRIELDELFIREWLAPVALKLFEDPTTDLLDEYTLMEELVANMLRLKSLTPLEARTDSAALLEDVTSHSGVLLPRGTDSDGRNLYGFLHQTFAEYFSAYYLAGRWEDGELELSDYAHDPYWLEVVLLMAGHLGIQRRAKAGRVLREIASFNSSEFESVMRRDLVLAARVLADGVPVGPGALVEDVLRDLVAEWTKDRLPGLTADITTVLRALGSTEYAAVVARVAREAEPTDDQVVSLGDLLGPAHFEDRLVALLNSSREELRAPAARLLAQAGDGRGLDCLEAFAHAEDMSHRYWAASLLATIDDVRATDALFEMLHDDDDFLRSFVARLVGERSAADASGALQEMILQDEDSFARQSAVEALLKRDDGEARALDVLDRVPLEVKVDVAQSLAAQGHPRGFDALLSVIQQGDVSAAWRAGRTLLTSSNENALAVMRRLVETRDADVRRVVVNVLAHQRHADTVHWLSPVLEDEEEDIRFLAAEVLTQQGDKHALEVVATFLTKVDAHWRLRAGGVLADRGDHRGLEVLRDILDSSEDPSLRGEAARWLIQTGDTVAVGALTDLLHGSDNDQRFYVAELLAGYGHAEGVDALMAYLSTAPQYRLDRAAEMITQADPQRARAVLDILVSRTVDDAPYILYGYVDARIQRLEDGPMSAVAWLFTHAHPSVRAASAICLGRLEGTEPLNTLLSLLTDPETEVRRMAATALVDRTDRASFRAVAERIPDMLADGDRPSTEAMLPVRAFESVADAAYGFLSRHLTPSGGFVDLDAGAVSA